MIKFILKIAGKENFEIDSAVPKSFIFGLCIKYFFMKLRGMFLGVGYKNISSKCFIGSKVRILVKKNIEIGDKVKIHNNVKIDALSTEGVKIGSGAVIGENCIIECTGTIRNIGKGIIIGNSTSFGGNCYLGAAGGIEIGNDVIAGQCVRFHSENHNYNNLNELIKNQGVSHKGIKVGNNCWIGAGAVFLDGAEIEDGCVVAANAVVTKKFSKNSIIAGVPAKVIGERKNEN